MAGPGLLAILSFAKSFFDGFGFGTGYGTGIRFGYEDLYPWAKTNVQSFLNTVGINDNSRAGFNVGTGNMRPPHSNNLRFN